MLGKLQVPGRPTNLDTKRARAFCAYSRCGWGLFGHFFSHLSLLSSFSLSLGDGCWLVGCFGFNDPLKQYFSLYRVVSQREGERGERIEESKKCPNNPHPHLQQAQ